MASPTQRSLQWYKKRGQFAYVCEKWIEARKIRKDAFGFGDVLAIAGAPTLVQVTSTGNMSSRIKKIRGECSAPALEWLRSGGLIEVHGWAQRVWRKKDGTKAKIKRWTLRRMVVEEIGGKLTAREYEPRPRQSEPGKKLKK